MLEVTDPWTMVTREERISLISLMTKNHPKKGITDHHQDLEKVQFVMTRTYLPKVKSPSILLTVSQFRSPRELAEWFSLTPSAGQKRQTSSSTPMLPSMTIQCCKVVGDQKYPGIKTHLQWVHKPKTCPGSSKYTIHSFPEFEPSRISHIHILSCQLHLVNPFKLCGTSDISPKWGAYIKYPLPTERGQCAMATGICKGMGGPHAEKALSPYTPADPPTLSQLCAYYKSDNKIIAKLSY